jgi:hypothetical protein
MALEVHLPQLVRFCALEPLRGWMPALLIQNQTMTHQHTMHRHHRQPDPFPLEQNCQLACAPVGPLPAKAHDPLFDL